MVDHHATDDVWKKFRLAPVPRLIDFFQHCFLLLPSSRIIAATPITLPHSIIVNYVGIAVTLMWRLGTAKVSPSFLKQFSDTIATAVLRGP